jgi:hypothetical protein
MIGIWDLKEQIILRGDICSRCKASIYFDYIAEPAGVRNISYALLKITPGKMTTVGLWRIAIVPVFGLRSWEDFQCRTCMDARHLKVDPARLLIA